MNTKRKGRYNERKAIKILESAGYYCVRSSASLGLFDIVAIGANGIRLIQVKTNRMASEIEVEAIEKFNGIPQNATKEIWVFKDYQRQPTIEIIP